MALNDRSRAPDGAGEQVRRAAVGPGRQLVARLAYDTQLEVLPRGVRTANRSERRLLLLAGECEGEYEAEYEIVLKVAADHATGVPTLSGQILADGLPATRAAITVVGGEHRAHPAVDEDGGFRVTGVPFGAFRLDVRIDADAIVVPDLNLGDWPPTEYAGLQSRPSPFVPRP